VAAYGTQPIITLSDKSVDATTGGWFGLPTGTIPGGSQYTFVVKYGAISSRGRSGLCGGGINGNNQTNNLRLSGTNYQNYWYANDTDFGVNSVNAQNGATVTCKYSGNSTAGRTTGYVNGILETLNKSPDRVNWKYLPGNEVLCKTTGDYQLYGKMYACFMFKTALSDADRTIAEAVAGI
jgi:hypothetical protein